MHDGLRLLAIDPKLKGVVIAGPPGTGKSEAARAFGRAWPGPFVEVPLGVTEDRLLGGLRIEDALRGRRRVAEGLLARAHGGVLYIDEINLLEPVLLRHVLGALASGVVRLEREGLSAVCPAEFVLLGTFDPREGELSLDEVGIHVAVDGPQPELRPHATRSRPAAIDDAQIRALSAEALRLGVRGHRADGFAVRAARAHAALYGREAVAEEDLRAAVRLVLAPRAKATPATAPQREGRTVEAAGASGHERVLPPEDASVPAGLLEARRREKANRGRVIRAVPRKGSRVALEATLRAAARAGRREVIPQDLRYKQFRRKAGLLIVFVVDASGSMAVNRIQQAKGAALRLLREAYLHRDSVALIRFRGEHAEVLLPPSRSVELARRRLDTLAVGGATPLAAGLHTAFELIRRAQREALLVLLTDGRANAGVGLEEACGALAAAGVASLVIDTNHRYSGCVHAARLARMLGARHVVLPGGVYDSVARLAETLR